MQANQISLLNKMGGHGSTTQQEEYTHVVACNANTDIVKDAMKDSKPVLTAEWLECCWNKNYSDMVDFDLTSSVSLI